MSTTQILHCTKPPALPTTAALLCAGRGHRLFVSYTTWADVDLDNGHDSPTFDDRIVFNVIVRRHSTRSTSKWASDEVKRVPSSAVK